LGAFRKYFHETELEIKDVPNMLRHTMLLIVQESLLAGVGAVGHIRNLG
jgi:hypothetical protein